MVLIVYGVYVMLKMIISIVRNCVVFLFLVLIVVVIEGSVFFVIGDILDFFLIL